DAACLGDVQHRFARAAFRRDPTPEERALYVTAEAGLARSPEELVTSLAAVVASPSFLYRIELGRDVPEADRPLSADELATRLAYHLWQEPPDAQLLASSAQLGTNDGYEAKARQMLADPRTRRSFHTFFLEWLELDHLKPLSERIDEPRFVAYADGLVPSEVLHLEMVRELLDFVDFIVWDTSGTFSDLFTSTVVRPPSKDVADLYGVPFEPGGPLQEDPERPGVLTRLAFLADPAPGSRPIHRVRAS
ncbi:MAG: DUF1592 domain-containing protein, partial [Myxococcales bacterium]|nr:DUF1592 domain-containing protein [Myxococcales bacterium]